MAAGNLTFTGFNIRMLTKTPNHQAGLRITQLLIGRQIGLLQAFGQIVRYLTFLSVCQFIAFCHDRNAELLLGANDNPSATFLHVTTLLVRQYAGK